MGVVGSGEMHNGVQLIAYADRFGGSLAALREVLDGPLAGLFGGVHILPFFTPFDGADAGFDPVDHTEVDSRLGSWDDVRALAREYVLMVDLIVNHVSADSAEFRDVLAHGAARATATKSRLPGDRRGQPSNGLAMGRMPAVELVRRQVQPENRDRRRSRSRTARFTNTTAAAMPPLLAAAVSAWLIHPRRRTTCARGARSHHNEDRRPRRIDMDGLHAR